MVAVKGEILSDVKHKIDQFVFRYYYPSHPPSVPLSLAEGTACHVLSLTRNAPDTRGRLRRMSEVLQHFPTEWNHWHMFHVTRNNLNPVASTDGKYWLTFWVHFGSSSASVNWTRPSGQSVNERDPKQHVLKLKPRVVGIWHCGGEFYNWYFINVWVSFAYI